MTKNNSRIIIMALLTQCDSDQISSSSSRRNRAAASSSSSSSSPSLSHHWLVETLFPGRPRSSPGREVWSARFIRSGDLMDAIKPVDATRCLALSWKQFLACFSCSGSDHLFIFSNTVSYIILLLRPLRISVLHLAFIHYRQEFSSSFSSFCLACIVFF